MALRLPDGAARLTALARHDTMLMLREPGPLVSRLIMPLALITLMRPLYLAALAQDGVQAGTAQVVTGMLVVFSLLALSVVGTAILTERSWRTWDRLRTTPTRTGELLTAKALPVFTLLVIQQAEILGFGAFAFGLRLTHLFLVAAAVLAWAVALLGIGTVLGSVLRSQSQLNVAYDIGGVALSALGGALVPLAGLPAWARRVAPASPGYWAMSALHSALRGETSATLHAAAILLAVGALSTAAAIWRITNGWTRSTVL